MANLQAFDNATGRPVNPGDTITTRRGERAVLNAATRATSGGRAGKVRVAWNVGGPGECYSTVFDLTIVDTDDPQSACIVDTLLVDVMPAGPQPTQPADPLPPMDRAAREHVWRLIEDYADACYSVGRGATGDGTLTSSPDLIRTALFGKAS